MPETVTLGPLLISTRVAAFIVAFLAARWVAARLGRRFELDVPWILRTVDGSVLAGLIAARATYVAVYWEAYAAAPWTALYFWQHGYLPVAGLAGGALYALYHLRAQRSDRRLPYLHSMTSGFAVGAVLLAGFLALMSWWADPDVLRAGDKVPEFELVNLTGEPVALSDYEDKAIVLNFWATWCPPCRREMPLLESAWNEYRPRDVVVVGIALGQSGDTVRPFVDSTGVTYPIWTDSGSTAQDGPDTNEIFGWFGSAGLPTTVFIRPDGVIDSVHLGEVDRALLLERVGELLH